MLFSHVLIMLVRLARYICTFVSIFLLAVIIQRTQYLVISTVCYADKVVDLIIMGIIYERHHMVG